MLSRVANCLYWMSRYIERAENTARIVDAYTLLARKAHIEAHGIDVSHAPLAPAAPQPGHAD